MTARQRTDIVIIFMALFVAGTLGYLEGKHAADRWYAQRDFTRLCLAGTSADDLASVWNPRGEWVGIMHSDGTRPIFTVGVDGAETMDIEIGFVPILYGHVVKLIPPIKVRTTEPVAFVEEHDIRPQPHAPVILYNLEHDGLCKWGYVDDLREGHMYDAPCRVASVEEPR